MREDVAVEEREAQSVLSIRATVEVVRLVEAQGDALRELWRSIRQQGVTPAGPPFVRYHTFGETETDVEVGVPISEVGVDKGDVTATELPGGVAITTWHLGAHDGLGEAYGRLAAWLQEHGRQAAGPAWEVYWWIDTSREPDPSIWPPPAEWRTELVQPIVGSEGGEG